MKIALAVALAAASLTVPAHSAPHRFVPGLGAPDGGPRLDPPRAATYPGTFRSWVGTPTDIPGSYVVSRGEFIVTDHPFDDTGANTDRTNDPDVDAAEKHPMLHGANAATGAYGDYTYPAGYDSNSADIVEVRLAKDDDNTHILIVLNAMTQPDRIAAQIAFTNGPGTLIAELFLRKGHGLLNWEHPIDTAFDAVQNIIEARVPRALFDPPDSHVFVGVGLWDGENDDWLIPQTRHLPPRQVPLNAPYFDLAFTAEPVAYWSDRVQASELADYRTYRNAFQIFWGCLEPGQPCFFPRPFNWPYAGLYTRVFRSGQDLGEGVTPQARYGQNEAFPYRLYRSSTQPYAVYAAAPRGDGPQPLVILLHFLGGNHMSYALTSFPDLAQWAEALGAIVVMPLGRGEAGWYEGEAEKDVFEVWRDIAQHYDIDRERVYLSGMSMGGFGTWRLGLLYPDQFAGAIAWASPIQPYAISAYPTPVMFPNQSPPACEPEAEGCAYTLSSLFNNALNLPFNVVHGGLDELVPSPSAEAWMNLFGSHGSEFRYVLYPTRRHETSFPGTTGNWILEWLGDLPVRDRNPSMVRYTVNRDFFQPEYGITYDRAYWVRDIRLGGAGSGTITVSRAGGETGLVFGAGDRYGADQLGPYRLRGQHRVPAEGASNEVNLFLDRIASATLDTRRMGLDLSEKIQIVGFHNTSPHATLRLHGPFPRDIVVTGAEFRRDGTDVILRLHKGPVVVSIEPA